MTAQDCACGCCTGVSARTPVHLTNRPGLREIAYRTGTYGQFRDSMTAGLSRTGRAGLAELTTRDPSDFAIALIDAWAVAADALTFYTERIANEHYLGTATERRSVAGLVGLIGYRLGLGVAAQTEVAFTVDTSPGSPPAVPITRGAKVQTLPGPGELPQTYETVDDITALASWNAPLVRQTAPRVPREGDSTMLLRGVASTVNRGDTLLVVADGATASTDFALVRVTEVRPNPVNQRTSVTFMPPLNGIGDAATARVYAMRQKAALFGYNAASPLMFAAEVKTALTNAQLLNATATDWEFQPVAAGAVALDGVYEGLTAGTPVFFTATGTLAHIASVGEATRTGYGISAKVSVLSLEVTGVLGDVGGINTRTTVVLLRGEELALADVPITDPVFGGTLDLDTPVTLDEPRRILIRGRRSRLTAPATGGGVVFDDGSPADAAALTDMTVLAVEPDGSEPPMWQVRAQTDGGRLATITAAASTLRVLPAHDGDPVVGETAMVDAVDGATLYLTGPLTHVYDRFPVDGRTFEIWGNIASATHGESVDEVLGSGDAARPHQRFTLRRAPLTFTQAPTVSGGTSTLRVWVNDIVWQEVPTLFGRGPRERVFATTTDDDGRTVVQFGDGICGARPATGQDNVRARYRAGTGLAGLAAADQVSLLMTRPLGVKAVINPLAADGAQDPQLGADAARNAPRTVLTLDRVVSLRDYEDFAAGFSGIGKAAATWTWDGVARGVILTVARTDGTAIAASSTLLRNLAAAIRAAGDPRVPMVIRPARIGLFTLEAALVVDPDYRAAAVLAAARDALLEHFSFTRRAFGQIVTLSEVDQIMAAVDGVRGALVGRLHRTGAPARRNAVLATEALIPGRPPADAGAEVLVIDPDTIGLGVAQ